MKPQLIDLDTELFEMFEAYSRSKSLYQSTTTGNFTNPHGPTKIGTASLFYDQNGNLTNYASTTNFWDYRNRLATSSASSTPSVTYWYDHTEQRVRKSNGISTTTTPNQYYEIGTTTASTVKSIFTPDGELVATVKGSGAKSNCK